MESSSDLSPIELAQIEAELQELVTSTREKYEHAKEEARRLICASRDVGLRNPDGTSAIVQACEMQRLTTRQYTEALRMLSEFVLDKKIPKDLPQRQS